MDLVSLIVGGALSGGGIYLGAYLTEKAKQRAVHEDFQRILTQLQKTTTTVEEVKAAVSGEVWRRDRKWECYAEIVKHLGELHTLIAEGLSLDPDHPSYEEKRQRADEAMVKARQWGSVARIAVGPNVRTVLTRFGDEWNRAGADGLQQGIVARWAWLVMADIARNDLFGDEREMPDEFLGDVEVPAP